MAITYRTDTLALKKLMIDKEIPTILKLSSKSGINRNTLSHILNGEIQPSADAMRKLVYALDIPPDQAGCIFFNRNLRVG
ncbi:helix-turn-helix domain-containing protein [Paenibacillus motobuensis]|uniref:helix-turn-helix domain-containing protein n=1 Tax=Paenibacillus TaxID=44249 RepID=UPI00203CFE7D|nr:MULTISPECIES: helix-turn-helix transcriptional regulator [Paenibacillus]MCM3041682.1 helix-turn-helix domain-containing protein [Paenibacillus lutimineralis]MCM3648786.1 helix-turn-helix domain-containing protein [Paenibacillus motobuensis]